MEGEGAPGGRACLPIAPSLQGSGEHGHHLGARTKCWDVEEGGEDVNQSRWGWWQKINKLETLGLLDRLRTGLRLVVKMWSETSQQGGMFSSSLFIHPHAGMD